MHAKYSLGIIITFSVLALVMLYILPITNWFFGTSVLTATKFFFTRIVLWSVLPIIYLYTRFIEKGKFLLWKDKKYNFSFYLIAIISLYFICLFGGGFLNMIIVITTQDKISPKLLKLQAIFKNNYPLIIFTCLTAGVVEELLMRGYIQPRIQKIYNNSIIGIVLSSLLFGILHSTYGTLGQVIIPFFIGLVFAIFYKKYYNLKILIVCHFMYDFISLMMMNFINIKQLTAF